MPPRVAHDAETVMRTIIFRDDDISYFTKPRWLEAIYGRVWEAGSPVCLAVIPWVYGDTRVYWTDGNPHDQGIPPEHRGKTKNFPVSDNRDLCDFLNDKATSGLVEICLHGYAHTFYEFITHDRAVIRQKLDVGMALLERAFPAASIRTFIPPYDRISPVALEELVARGFNISTRSLNLAPVPQLPQISGFASGEIRAGQKLFVCDDYFFSTSAILLNHCAWRGGRWRGTNSPSSAIITGPSSIPGARSRIVPITPPGMTFSMRRLSETNTRSQVSPLMPGVGQRPTHAELSPAKLLYSSLL